MNEILKALGALVQKVHWSNALPTIVLLGALLIIYTFYENRQSFYEQINSVARIQGKQVVPKTTDKGERIIWKLMMTHPEIVMATVVDADLNANRRTVRGRLINNAELRNLMIKYEQQGVTGDGPLITDNAELNKQVYAMLNGKMRCDPSQQGVVNRLYPGIEKIIMYSCRVPIPPAYGKVTGWITLHFISWPPPFGYDDLENAALETAKNYFEAEIEPRAVR